MLAAQAVLRLSVSANSQNTWLLHSVATLLHPQRPFSLPCCPFHAFSHSPSNASLAPTDTYYPINTAQCCTPALLLENGDAWELERCQCRESSDRDFPVNCGGTNSDELLLGYIFFRCLGLLSGAVVAGLAGRHADRQASKHTCQSTALARLPLQPTPTHGFPHPYPYMIAFSAVLPGCPRWATSCQWARRSVARPACQAPSIP